ncbi:reverse transcriptase domain-containing protein [Tanacetum coccineum]
MDVIHRRSIWKLWFWSMNHFDRPIRKGNHSNNEAEYEALIAGLELAIRLEVRHLQVFSNSLLVTNHVKGMHEALEESMKWLALDDDDDGVISRFSLDKRIIKNLVDRVSQLHLPFSLPERLKANSMVRVNRISQVTYRKACLMLALEGFPSSL